MSHQRKNTTPDQEKKWQLRMSLFQCIYGILLLTGGLVFFCMAVRSGSTGSLLFLSVLIIVIIYNNFLSLKQILRLIRQRETPRPERQDVPPNDEENGV